MKNEQVGRMNVTASIEWDGVLTSVSIDPIEMRDNPFRPDVLHELGVIAGNRLYWRFLDGYNINPDGTPR